MKLSFLHRFSLLVILPLIVFACAYRTPEIVQPVPPIPSAKWLEIEKALWSASTLANIESKNYAREAMQEWMERVREKTDSEFIPWYTGYWAQQWIGIKAGWYEMGKEDDEPPVEEYLTEYIQEKFDELVLEPASEPLGPKLITEQTAALYIQLLAIQLQYIPEIYNVQTESLRQRFENIPLITINHDRKVSLALLLERDNLDNLPPYEALLSHAKPVPSNGNSSSVKDSLQIAAEETISRMVAELPVRAGGSSAAVLIGETLGLFITAGVSVWSLNSHEKKKPEIESQLRDALKVGLDKMWEILMEDPELGVMYPVNHMNQKMGEKLFSDYEYESSVQSQVSE